MPRRRSRSRFAGCRAGGREHLRGEQAQLAVPEHDAIGAGLDAHLLEDLEGRGEGFGEDGELVGHARGHGVEIRDRHAHELGEGAVGAQDAHHVAAGTVSPQAGRAERAAAAREVDLAHDALADERRRALDDRSDELVSEHAAEAEVALHDLEIGVADPRQRDAHDRGLGVRLRERDVAYGSAVSVEHERTHAPAHR
jgi:hypothetical protein